MVANNNTLTTHSVAVFPITNPLTLLILNTVIIRITARFVKISSRIKDPFTLGYNNYISRQEEVRLVGGQGKGGAVGTNLGLPTTA